MGEKGEGKKVASTGPANHSARDRAVVSGRGKDEEAGVARGERRCEEEEEGGLEPGRVLPQACDHPPVAA